MGTASLPGLGVRRRRWAMPRCGLQSATSVFDVVGDRATTGRRFLGAMSCECEANMVMVMVTGDGTSAATGDWTGKVL